MDRLAHKNNKSAPDGELAEDFEKIKAALLESSLAQHAADYITEKPFKTVSIAILAGIVIGFMLRK